MPGRAKPDVGKAGVGEQFWAVSLACLCAIHEVVSLVSLQIRMIQNECAALDFLFQYVMKQESEPRINHWKCVCIHSLWLA